MLLVSPAGLQKWVDVVSGWSSQGYSTLGLAPISAGSTTVKEDVSSLPSSLCFGMELCDRGISRVFLYTKSV